MKAELLEALDKLPVTQKAHKYEPSIEDVVDVAFKAGIKEVVEQLYKHRLEERVKEESHYAGGVSNWAYEELSDMPWWQAKLKEWGIKAD